MGFKIYGAQKDYYLLNLVSYYSFIKGKLLTRLLYPKYASPWKEVLLEGEYWNKRNSIKQSPKANSSVLRRSVYTGQNPKTDTKVDNLDEVHISIYRSKYSASSCSTAEEYIHSFPTFLV